MADRDDGQPAETCPAQNGTCDRTHRFPLSGMYTVKLTVRDGDGGGSDQGSTMVIVYDPHAGFTNGDGSLTSPVGAWTPSPTTSGET